MRLRHLVALTAVAVLGATFAAAAGSGATRAPVTTFQDPQFGTVLATKGRKALYWWNVEKKGFRVRCTGACAKAWPPLIVRSRASVPKRVKGVRGTFGVVRRPDGRLQVTWNRLPIYTYAHERARQVLCNDVDGWFVVRA